MKISCAIFCHIDASARAIQSPSLAGRGPANSIRSGLICNRSKNSIPMRSIHRRLAAPSEGKGHTFESCRVRHFFLFYSTIHASALRLQFCFTRVSKQFGRELPAYAEK
jgi:hypothetical protein